MKFLLVHHSHFLLFHYVHLHLIPTDPGPGLVELEKCLKLIYANRTVFSSVSDLVLPLFHFLKDINCWPTSTPKQAKRKAGEARDTPALGGSGEDDTMNNLFNIVKRDKFQGPLGSPIQGKFLWFSF